ncbi:NAD(P)H-dependent oxidoreductase [Butyrivibrio sp. MC2021]|uniref:NAD(P)H-dependent oxidoreductase n=1 Tax=Butyrivibrio sp. MC2021 TaxID=1408306 RepID=UPI00047E5F78|nr:NAD(P)H-dependent oxidoreductase [Butyrivibrio sp. MC2021]
MVLYVNACARTDSRTNRIASEFLEKIDGEIKEVKLSEVSFPDTSEEFLRKRDGFIAANNFEDPYFDLAKQFAQADTIVIAAPYWDLSFPAVLKQYIEHINVLGITFEYSPQGTPIALCKAKKLYYIMTAGGAYVPEEFGFGYIKALAQNFYGIKDVELIKATGLDIQGNDPDEIVQNCINMLPEVL